MMNKPILLVKPNLYSIHFSNEFQSIKKCDKEKEAFLLSIKKKKVDNITLWTAENNRIYMWHITFIK